jgi:hypothetical protein
MVSPKVTNRYPRPGQRIAPRTLREFLTEPLPAELRKAPADTSLKLCDLDETTWERFPSDAIVELSELIVRRVANCHDRKVFLQRRFPRPAEGIRLEDLRLENRTRRCLARAGFEDDPRGLADRTIGEILSIRSFGPRCLVDLLTALESPQGTGHRSPSGRLKNSALSEELTAAAKQLASLPMTELAHREDPRFRQTIQSLDMEARTAGELGERLLARSQELGDPVYATEQLQRLIAQITELPELTLEEELIAIFASAPCERNQEILIGYYGWKDGRQHTLTEIGAQFGVTRERIRQICAKLTKKHKDISTILAPVMDRALALIDKRLPCPAATLENELAEMGLTRISMPLEGVTRGAKLLGRAPSFKIVKVDKDRLAVRSDQVAAVQAIVDLAKKEIYFHGLATIEKIEAMVSEKFSDHIGGRLAAETLQLIRGFAYLDESSGWFRLIPIAKHGLPKAIDKILAVAGQVTVSEMRQAMSRNRRLWKDPPPGNVLLAFCRQMPDVRVEGDHVYSDPPRDWKKSLTGVEAKLVHVLKEHGPLMERGAMEDLCVASGMNRFSFHAFVSWSPVIVQFGHSVYGLLGTKVSQQEVDDLIAGRRAKRLTHRVLDSHGRTEDGKVWLKYRLSKAASTYAVITIPAALKQVVHGKFHLIGPEGRKIGTLATKDGRAWGLGAFLRERGARIGDHIVLTLDLDQRTAVVSMDDTPS